MNFIASIFHGIKTAAVWVADVFVKLFGKDASAKFAQSAMAILKSDLGKIVLTVVTTLESASELTSAQKRDAAFSKIKATASAAGVDAADSLINLLIELAVSQLKANFGEASAS